MSKYPILALAAIMMALGCPAWAAPQDELVGSITDVRGPVHLVRAGNEVIAEKGARLYSADVLRTDQGASVGVVLRDDTTLSLGPASELRMSEFQFNPDQGILGMTLTMVKGTLVYVSGQIAKLAPGSAQIETPAGVAAVRGTELLVEVPASKAAKPTEKTK